MIVELRLRYGVDGNVEEGIVLQYGLSSMSGDAAIMLFKHGADMEIADHRHSSSDGPRATCCRSSS